MKSAGSPRLPGARSPATATCEPAVRPCRFGRVVIRLERVTLGAMKGLCRPNVGDAW